MTAYRMLGALTVSGLLLGACGGGSGSSPAAGEADASGTASPGKGATAAANPTASTTGAAASYAVPASCASLRVDPAATLPGGTVGKCWAEALYAHGSMRAFTSGPPAQTGEIVLRPQLKFSSKSSDGDQAIFVDNQGYRLKDGRWIKGDKNSDDYDEVITGSMVDLVKGLYSPSGISAVIAACPTYAVDPRRVSVTFEDKSVHDDLVHLTCTSSFPMIGTTVSDAALWVRSDWTPIRGVSTATFGGSSATSAVEYSDHGKAFEITAPSAG